MLSDHASHRPLSRYLHGVEQAWAEPRVVPQCELRGHHSCLWTNCGEVYTVSSNPSRYPSGPGAHPPTISKPLTSTVATTLICSDLEYRVSSMPEVEQSGYKRQTSISANRLRVYRIYGRVCTVSTISSLVHKTIHLTFDKVSAFEREGTTRFAISARRLETKSGLYHQFGGAWSGDYHVPLPLIALP